MLIKSRTSSYTTLGYDIDKKEFYKKIYSFYDLPEDCDEYTLLVKLRESVKDNMKFHYLMCHLGMSAIDLLTIIHDDFPRIFNKVTRKYIKQTYKGDLR